MRAVVQLSGKASVTVEGKIVGSIDSGLLVYLGIEKSDDSGDLNYMVEKVANLRVFPDASGRMNKSLLEIGEEALVVSQFTLYADARKGRRPSYERAAAPEAARRLYDEFVLKLQGRGIPVSTGVFQASMEVSSVNLGPVTVLLDSAKEF